MRAGSLRATALGHARADRALGLSGEVLERWGGARRTAAIGRHPAATARHLCLFEPLAPPCWGLVRTWFEMQPRPGDKLGRIWHLEVATVGVLQRFPSV